MVEDLGGAVHLAKDNNHLIIDELLELSQIANHLHLQLCPNLKKKSYYPIHVLTFFEPQDLLVLFKTFRFWWILHKVSNQEDF